MTGTFRDNNNQSRYEYRVENATAFANYHKKDSTLFIDYVEAPPELRGTGAAGQLMQHVMETARTEQMKVVPICGYAAAWISRHKEYDDLKG